MPGFQRPAAQIRQQLAGGGAVFIFDGVDARALQLERFVEDHQSLRRHRAQEAALFPAGLFRRRPEFPRTDARGGTGDFGKVGAALRNAAAVAEQRGGCT